MNMQQRLAVQIAALACCSGLASAVWVVNVGEGGTTMPWPSGECILMGADKDDPFMHSRKFTCEDKDTVSMEYWKTYDCSGQSYKKHQSLKFAEHMPGMSCSEVSSYDGYIMRVTYKGSDCSADTICTSDAMPLNHCIPFGTASLNYSLPSMHYYATSTDCSGDSLPVPIAIGGCDSLSPDEKGDSACGHGNYIRADQLSALQASRSDKADSPKNSTDEVDYQPAGAGECTGTYIIEFRGGETLESCMLKCETTRTCVSFALGKTSGNEAGYCHLYSTVGKGDRNPDNYDCYNKKGGQPGKGDSKGDTMMTCGAVAKAYKASKCCKNPTAKFYMEMGMDKMEMDKSGDKSMVDKSGSGKTRLLQSGDTFETEKEDLFKAIHTTMSRMEPNKAKELASKIEDVLAGYMRSPTLPPIYG